MELWWPTCSVEQNHLCNFERGYHGKLSCEVIWNLDQWFRRICRLKKKFMDGCTTDGHKQCSIINLQDVIIDGWLRMGLLPPLGNFADISYLVEN